METSSFPVILTLIADFLSPLWINRQGAGRAGDRAAAAREDAEARGGLAGPRGCAGSQGRVETWRRRGAQGRGARGGRG